MMNKRNIWSASLAVALGTFALTAFAQDAPKTPAQDPVAAQARRQGQGQGQRGARVTLATLPIKALDASLKLSDEQKTKITAIQEKYRTDAQALRPAQGAQPDPANRQKLTTLVVDKLAHEFGLEQQLVVSHQEDVMHAVDDLLVVTRERGGSVARWE